MRLPAARRTRPVCDFREGVGVPRAVAVVVMFPEAAGRRALLAAGNEIGAGPGPSVGWTWRIGPMGSYATKENRERFPAAPAAALPEVAA